MFVSVPPAGGSRERPPPAPSQPEVAGCGQYRQRKQRKQYRQYRQRRGPGSRPLRRRHAAPRRAARAAGRRGRHLSCSPSAAGRGTQRGSRSAAAGGDLSLQTFSGPVNLFWSQMRGTKVSIKKYRASEVTKRQLVMTYKMHAIF